MDDFRRPAGIHPYADADELGFRPGGCTSASAPGQKNRRQGAGFSRKCIGGSSGRGTRLSDAGARDFRGAWGSGDDARGLFSLVGRNRGVRWQPKPHGEHAKNTQNAVLALTDVFGAAVAERRRNKESDLISLLIDIKEEGEAFTEEDRTRSA